MTDATRLWYKGCIVANERGGGGEVYSQEYYQCPRGSPTSESSLVNPVDLSFECAMKSVCYAAQF